jgi:hypothetical protein
MKKNTKNRRENEKEIVGEMINIYCKGNHNKKTICLECQGVLIYANTRIDNCPFMENKPFCSNCKIHCYKPEMREKICKVMRYSGRKILFYHPIMAIRHIIESKKEKKRLEK